METGIILCARTVFKTILILLSSVMTIVKDCFPCLTLVFLKQHKFYTVLPDDTTIIYNTKVLTPCVGVITRFIKYRAQMFKASLL